MEDPAQAWNTIAVGGYTDLVNIQEPHFRGYSPLVNAGDISPYTRTSTRWLQGKSPFKPDIVMEAGNRAVSPSRTDAYDADSLALLSTGPNTDVDPLVSFRATSAATAQAARLAARLVARFPDYSLVVSLRSHDTDVDLYTPISVMMETGIGVEAIVVPAKTTDQAFRDGAGMQCGDRSRPPEPLRPGSRWWRRSGSLVG